MDSATLHVEIMVTCPNKECEEYLDLFNEEETGVINDEGQLWNIIHDSRRSGGWRNLGIECVCYKCKTEFTVDEMEY